MPRVKPLLTMTLLLVGVGELTGQPLGAQAPAAPDPTIEREREIPELGLRAAYYYSASTRTTGQIVTAVQKGGAAMMAGLLPGDLIVALQGRTPRVPDDIVVATTGGSAETVRLGIEVRGAKGERSISTVALPVELARSESWMSAPPKLRFDFATRERSPLIESERAAARQAFPARLDAILAEARGAPCGQAWYERFGQIQRELRAFRSRLGDTLVRPDIALEVQTWAERSCSASLYGELPDTEAILYSMATGRTNACEFRDGAGEEAIANAVRETVSAARYNDRFASEVERGVQRLPSAQRACVLQFLERRLLKRQTR